jgi:hypothetical protein
MLWDKTRRPAQIASIRSQSENRFVSTACFPPFHEDAELYSELSFFERKNSEIPLFFTYLRDCFADLSRHVFTPVNPTSASVPTRKKFTSIPDRMVISTHPQV